MKSWTYISLAGAMLILFAGCRLPENVGKATPATAIENTAAHKVFPDFKVKSLEGQEVALSQYRGRIVILDLFATWCPPCRMEIPHLVELQKAYPDTLAVIGLAYDQIAVQKLRTFMQDMGINYPVYWGSDEIAQFVGLRGIPHLIVLDQKGQIFQSYVGYQDKEVFEADIRQLQSSNP